MKPVVRLFDAVGSGIVICCESGILIANQTGGTSCLQPEAEGIYVPLRNDYGLIEPTLEAELTAYFTGPKHGGAGATSGLDIADADFIDAQLVRVRLASEARVDRSRLSESHEAWIYLTISGDETEDEDLALFAHFTPYPRSGILTWPNSD